MRLKTLKYILQQKIVECARYVECASESTIFFTVVLYDRQYFLDVLFSVDIIVVLLKGTCLGGLSGFLVYQIACACVKYLPLI